VELPSQLKTGCADQEEMRQNSRPLKQNSVPAATLFEKLTPDAATIFSSEPEKKLKTDLGHLKAILQILES
jgi:hypothetical protein